MCHPLAQVLTLGFLLMPSVLSFTFWYPYVDGFLAWLACYCEILLDVLHQFVMMAIASLSPLFS